MVDFARPHNSKARPRSLEAKSRSRVAYAFVGGVVFASVSASSFAAPLTSVEFNSIASSCAPAVDVSILRAVASVESHFDQLAIRDNTTGEAWAPKTVNEAASIVEMRLAKGHSVDLGLMQINSANLSAHGLTILNAFDACHSLTAARDILVSGMAAGSSDTQRQAAMLIALSRYNTGHPLAGIGNGYADRVIAAQSAVGPEISRPQVATASRWNIWGGDHAATSSWVLTANKSSETERAGAQTSDARFEGRAPAISSEKGEPYEVSAYRESEASLQ